MVFHSQAEGFSKFFVSDAGGGARTSFAVLPPWFDEMVEYIAAFNHINTSTSTDTSIKEQQPSHKPPLRSTGALVVDGPTATADTTTTTTTAMTTHAVKKSTLSNLVLPTDTAGNKLETGEATLMNNLDRDGHVYLYMTNWG